MEIVNNVLFCFYFTFFIVSVVIGFLNYKKLNLAFKILLYILLFALLFDLFGNYIFYKKLNTNSAYIIFDFIVSNFYLYFYFKSFFALRFKFIYFASLLLNTLIFFFCFRFFNKISNSDFIYTLIITVSILLLGLKLFWDGTSSRSKIVNSTLQVNLLILYFVLMAFVSKFFTYYYYLDDNINKANSELFIYIYNIFGFSYSIKLFLSKNAS